VDGITAEITWHNHDKLETTSEKSLENHGGNKKRYFGYVTNDIWICLA
jgi:hypothetical protein